MARRRVNREIRQQPDHRANRTILVRTLCLMVIFGVVAFVPLLAKLYEIQIVKYDEYTARALDQQTPGRHRIGQPGHHLRQQGNPLWP